MQTHSNKTPHEQDTEATSTYRAFGGDIQPYPEPNNVAIENHLQQQRQLQQKQSHFDKSLRSNNCNNPSLQKSHQTQTQGLQQKSSTTPQTDSSKNTDFSNTQTKATITATTATRRYSRFENTEALERRVSTASSGSGGGGGGSRSLAATTLAEIITADAGGATAAQLQQQQHTFGSRTYADGRIKRASIYGTDAGKLKAGGGSGRDSSGSLIKRHSGTFTGEYYFYEHNLKKICKYILGRKSKYILFLKNYESI